MHEIVLLILSFVFYIIRAFIFKFRARLRKLLFLWTPARPQCTHITGTHA
jgi:hypothetical protein